MIVHVKTCMYEKGESRREKGEKEKRKKVMDQKRKEKKIESLFPFDSFIFLDERLFLLSLFMEGVGWTKRRTPQ